MIKAVIFDFYGVICADAYKAWQHHYVSDYEAHAKQFADISRRSDEGSLPLSDFYQELATIAGSTPAEVRDQLGQWLTIDLETMRLISDLKSHKVLVGLLSNSPTTLYDLLEHNHITDQFDQILTSEEAGFLKPSPEIFQLMLESFNIKPAETVFVDDRQYNVDGATAAGLVGLLYTSPNQLRRQLGQLGVL